MIEPPYRRLPRWPKTTLGLWLSATVAGWVGAPVLLSLVNAVGGQSITQELGLALGVAGVVYGVMIAYGGSATFSVWEDRFGPRPRIGVAIILFCLPFGLIPLAMP